MQDHHSPISRGYLGELPAESIFESTPATHMSRLLALVIDVIIIWGIVLLLTGILSDNGVSDTSRGPSFGNQPEESDSTGEFFVTSLLYFVICERATGKTVGKKMMGIKVVNKYDGESIGTWQSFGRNLLRYLDLILFGLIGLISMEKSDQNQRVGDRAMSTIVINDRKP